MSLEKKFGVQYLLEQQGNYLYVKDKTSWPVGIVDRDQVVDCVFWRYSDSTDTYATNFLDEEKRFLIDIGVDYDVHIYAIKRWSGYTLQNEVVWYASKVWIAMMDTPNPPSSSSTMEWIEISGGSTSINGNVPGELWVNYYFKGVTI